MPLPSPEIRGLPYGVRQRLRLPAECNQHVEMLSVLAFPAIYRRAVEDALNLLREAGDQCSSTPNQELPNVPQVHRLRRGRDRSRFARRRLDHRALSAFAGIFRGQVH